MLEAIKIRNFQSHRKTTFRFDPHVTTIVGPSDVGKSAVIRAIMWLMRNRPIGDAHINDEADTAVVQMLVDGRRIMRRRTRNGANIYTLDDLKYMAFGNAVPGAIADVLNIDDINFQGQHDNPFWLANTAGDVAKRLNAIVNLDVIDRVLATLAQDVRRLSTAVEVATTRYREARATSRALQYVDDLKEDFATLTTAHAHYAWAAAKASQAHTRIAEATKYRTTGQRAAAAAQAGQAAIVAGGIARAARAGAIRLASTIVAAETCAAAKGKKLPNLKKLSEAFARAWGARQCATGVRQAVTKAETLRGDVSRAVMAVAREKTKFKDKTGGICPVCKNPLRLP